MRLGSAVRDWFLAPQPQHALVGARIVFGLTLFAAYATRANVLPDYFGPGGFGGHDFYARVPTMPPLDADPALWLGVLRWVPSEAAVAGLYALLLLSTLAFAAGARTRTSGALALALHLLFYARNPYAYNGAWAEFVVAPFLYTVLAPTGRHWSLDAWWKRRRAGPSWRPPSWDGPGWALRLLQINTAVLYLTAGMSRLDKASWLSGEMVFVALSGAAYSRLVIDWRPLLPALKLVAWGALVLEALAPFFLWLGPLGRFWALGLVALHVGLELTLNIGMWSYVAIGCLLSFLLPWSRTDA